MPGGQSEVPGKQFEDAVFILCYYDIAFGKQFEDEFFIFCYYDISFGILQTFLVVGCHECLSVRLSQSSVGIT